MPKGTCLFKWNDEAATRWSFVLPRCNSICGKQSAAEYTREPVRCKLVCSAPASHRCVCCRAHLYLQIGYGQATETALPRRNSICGKQSAAEYTQEFKHLNRNKTRKIHCNLLRDFLLCGFSKHLHRFRCSGKWEHLNPAARWNQAVKQLTTNALQDFRQLYPWFRSQTGLERRRMQMRPGGVSGKGVHQPRSRVAQASEPE